VRLDTRFEQIEDKVGAILKDVSRSCGLGALIALAQQRATCSQARSSCGKQPFALARAAITSVALPP